ncbi:hypothetical protein N7523_005734 [Penicillium sp. IBT 18751x]|nr:hypothetical protein N7523_005673 [Penicillium sp. IBT 18751x]KAJ6117983.1 hypothetical protein N7523_005734 [Penicillium sp. IBT 18751x]
MSMIGVLPVHSPSGRRASSPKAKLTKSKLTKTKLTKTKLNKTPRERNNRGRRGTTTKTDTPLSAPLSELTAHMADVPLRDMDAWVHRSTEVRLQENAERETIARPMNSFMLYRSAYAERIKRLLSQNAHHFVSSTAGKSWWIEPAHITDKYKELAQIECEAHSRAHPTYKLKFKKGPPTTTRPDEYTPSPLTNTLEDEHSMAPPIPWTQSYEYPPSSRGSTCFGSSDSFMTHGGYLGSSWNTSHPSVSMVYPQPLITRHIEVLQFHHGSPMSQDIQYGASNSLVGLPGGTHHELLQPQVVHPPAGHLPNGPINLEFLDLSF